MTDNEIIKALECCSHRNEDLPCDGCPAYNIAQMCMEDLMSDALDLINRQKAEIERLNKNYEELIYKTECLLCHATGNKFSKYTYTTQEMLSFVDDYIQDCCDEAIEETKATVKSEAIKEFAYLVIDRSRNGVIYTSDIPYLVKEMTEVETIRRKEDEGK